MSSLQGATQGGQRVPPLARKISHILKGAYNSTDAVFLEQIQNAEDAKADEVGFLLCGPESDSVSGADSRLNNFLGPSLLVYNSGSFSKNDKENITRVEDSDKRNDPMSVGRFGLGFNSVYHLTDMPWLLSNGSWMTFDPLYLAADRSSGHPGLRFDGENVNAADKEVYLKSFCVPFWTGDGNVTAAEFQQTIFRLPLRANPSMLSDETFTFESMQTLMLELRAKLPHYLKFMSHVQKISFHVRLPDSSNIVTLFSAEKKWRSPSHPLMNFLRDVEQFVRDVKAWKEEDSEEEEEEEERVPLRFDENLCWHSDFDICVYDQESDSPLREESYIIKFALVRGGKIFDFILEESTPYLPLVGVCLPLSGLERYEGNVFCTLPLPFESRLPGDINARFELSTDRRSMNVMGRSCRKGKAETEARWNTYLLDEIGKLYLDLVGLVHRRGMSVDRYFPRTSHDIFRPLSVYVAKNLAEIYVYNMNKIVVCPEMSLSKAVMGFLRQVDRGLVELDEMTWNFLKEASEGLDIVKQCLCSPYLLRELIYEGQAYLRDLSVEHALLLLQYALTDVQALDSVRLECLPLFPVLGGRVSGPAIWRIPSTSDALARVQPFLESLNILDESALDNLGLSHLGKQFDELPDARLAECIAALPIESTDSGWRALTLAYIGSLDLPHRQPFNSLRLISVMLSSTATGYAPVKCTGVIDGTNLPDPIKHDLWRGGCQICEKDVASVVNLIHPSSAKGVLDCLKDTQSTWSTNRCSFPSLFAFFAEEEDFAIDPFLKVIPMFPMMGEFRSLPDSWRFYNSDWPIDQQLHVPSILFCSGTQEKSLLRKLGVDSIDAYHYLVDFVLPDNRFQLLGEPYDLAARFVLGQPLQGEWYTELSFIRTTKDQYRRPVDLLHPDLMQLHPSSPNVPAHLFHEPILVDMLLKMGMRTALARAECNEVVSEICSLRDSSRSLGLLAHVRRYEKRFIQGGLIDSDAIMQAPWIYDKNDGNFYRPGELVAPKDASLASLIFHVWDAEPCVEWLCRAPLNIETFLKQNSLLVERKASGSEQLARRIIEEVKQPIDNFYFWIERLERFVPAAQLSVSPFPLNSSYIPKLPEDFLSNSYHAALNLLGVQNKLSLATLTDILTSVQTENTNVCDEPMVKFVMALLEEIAHVIKPEIRFPVLTSSGEWSMNDQILFNDMTWAPNEDGDCLTHDRISKQLADRLGIASRYQKIGSTRLQTFDSGIEGCESFGQQTLPILDRLKGIIGSEYTLGDPLFVELIQNSDDALASRVEFTFSDRTFPKESLCDPSLSDSQGPAMYCFNDQLFLPKDFESIQRVERSGKANDPSKTGRFGLGFNVVYHITDKPSFISGEYWVVFDPHGSIRSGGLKAKLSDVAKYYQDQLAPFLAVRPDLYDSKRQFFNGTLFRFPLRTEIRELGSKIITTAELNVLADNFIRDSPHQGLLFAVSTRRLLFRNENLLRYEVQMDSDLFDEEKKLRNLALQRQCKKQPTLSHGTRTCTLIAGGKTIISTFRIAAGTFYTPEMQNLANSEQFVSFASVAVQTDGQGVPVGNISSQKLYCTMPLNKQLNLPVLINARFLPSKTRTELFIDSSHSWGEWNELLLSLLVAPLYTSLVLELRSTEQSRLTEYYKIWPQGYNVDGFYHNHLVTPVLNRLYESDSIFSSTMKRWTSPEKGIFYDRDTPQEILSYLSQPSEGLFLVAPNERLDMISKAWNQPRSSISCPKFLMTLIFALQSSATSLPYSGVLAAEVLQFVFKTPTPSDLIPILLEKPGLIPVVSGSLQILRGPNGKQKLYVVDDEQQSMLSHISDRLIHQDSPWLKNSLSALESSTNVIVLSRNPECAVQELESKCIRMEDLPAIWSFLRKQTHLQPFEELPIMPIKSSSGGTEIVPLVSEAFSQEAFARFASMVGLLTSLGLRFVLPSYEHAHPLVHQYLHVLDLSLIAEHLDPQKVFALSDEDLEKLRMFIIGAFGHTKCKHPRLQELRLFHSYRGTRQSASAIQHLPACSKKKLDLLTPAIQLCDLEICRCSCGTKIDDLCQIIPMVKMDMNTTWRLLAEKVPLLPLEKQPDVIYALLQLITLDNLKDLSFIPTNEKKPSYKKPCDLYDPKNEAITKLITDRTFYPHQSLSDDVLSALKHLGMRTSIPKSDVMRYARDITKNLKEPQYYDRGVQMAMALAAYCKQNRASIAFWDELREVAWIPCEPRDPELPKSLWCPDTFCRPSSACSHSSPLRICKPVIDRRVESLLPELVDGTQASAEELDKVICQVLDEIERAAPECVIELYFELLRALNSLQTNRMTSYMAPSPLRFVHRAWIFDERSCKLYSSSQVFRSLDDRLEPYFITLPTKIRRLYGLEQLVDIQVHPSATVISQTLSSLMTDVPIPEQNVGAVIRLVSLLADRFETTENREDVLPVPVLTQSCELRMSDQVISSDAKWLCEGSSDPRLELHDKLSSARILRNLEIRTTRQMHCQEAESLGDPFGQSVRLEDRIREVLSEYPEAAVPQEFLQNSDDARSSSVSFFLDVGADNPSAKILSDSMKELQKQPSLLIFNSSVFSDDDFQRIIRVGGGGKRADYTKTGQFGIGSLSMYHLTDCPMFITGAYFCVFDPLLKYVSSPTDSQPGKRFRLSFLLERYPDHCAPFFKHPELANRFNKDTGCFDGTVFRLPFRKAASKLSENIPSSAAVQHLVGQLTRPETLLFLKHVERISFSDVTLAKKVQSVVRGTSVALRDFDLPHMQNNPISIDYDAFVTVSVLCNGDKKTTEYLVCQTLSTRHPEVRKRTMTNDRTRNIPLAGVAVALGVSSLDAGSKGRMFATLPLPLRSFNRVHLNGGFHLSSNRRSIPDTRDQHAGESGKWNELLVSKVTSSVFIRMLETLQDKIVDMESWENASYWDILPPPPQSQEESITSLLAKVIWKKLLDEDLRLQVWPHLNSTGWSWTSAHAAWVLPKLGTPQAVQGFLLRQQIPLANPPADELGDFCRKSMRVLSPAILWKELSRQSAQRENTAYSLEYIKDEEEAWALTTYCSLLSPCDSVLLLPQADGLLGWTGANTPHFYLQPSFKGLIPSELIIWQPAGFLDLTSMGVRQLTLKDIATLMDLIFRGIPKNSVVLKKNPNHARLQKWQKLLLRYIGTLPEEIPTIDLFLSWPLLSSSQGHLYSPSVAAHLPRTRQFGWGAPVESPAWQKKAAALLTDCGIDYLEGNTVWHNLDQIIKTTTIESIHSALRRNQPVLFTPGSQEKELRERVLDLFQGAKAEPPAELAIFLLYSGDYVCYNGYRLLPLNPPIPLPTAKFLDEKNAGYLAEVVPRLSPTEYVRRIFESKYYDIDDHHYQSFLRYMSTLGEDEFNPQQYSNIPWVKTEIDTYQRPKDLFGEALANQFALPSELRVKFPTFTHLFVGIHTNLSTHCITAILTHICALHGQKRAVQANSLLRCLHMAPSDDLVRVVAGFPVFRVDTGEEEQGDDNDYAFSTAEDILHPKHVKLASSQGQKLHRDNGLFKDMFNDFFLVPTRAMISSHLIFVLGQLRNAVRQSDSNQFQKLQKHWRPLMQWLLDHPGVKIKSQNQFILVHGVETLWISLDQCISTDDIRLSCAPLFWTIADTRSENYPICQEVISLIQQRARKPTVQLVLQEWNHLAGQVQNGTVNDPNQQQLFVKLFSILLRLLKTDPNPPIAIKFPSIQWALLPANQLCIAQNKLEQIAADEATNMLQPQLTSAPEAFAFFTNIGVEVLQITRTLDPNWRDEKTVTERCTALNSRLQSDLFVSVLQILCEGCDKGHVQQVLRRIQVIPMKRITILEQFPRSSQRSKVEVQRFHLSTDDVDYILVQEHAPITKVCKHIHSLLKLEGMDKKMLKPIITNDNLLRFAQRQNARYEREELPGKQLLAVDDCLVRADQYDQEGFASEEFVAVLLDPERFEDYVYGIVRSRVRGQGINAIYLVDIGRTDPVELPIIQLYRISLDDRSQAPTLGALENRQLLAPKLQKEATEDSTRRYIAKSWRALKDQSPSMKQHFIHNTLRRIRQYHSQQSTNTLTTWLREFLHQPTRFDENGLKKPMARTNRYSPYIRESINANSTYIADYTKRQTLEQQREAQRQAAHLAQVQALFGQVRENMMRESAFLRFLLQSSTAHNMHNFALVQHARSLVLFALRLFGLADNVVLSGQDNPRVFWGQLSRDSNNRISTRLGENWIELFDFTDCYAYQETGPALQQLCDVALRLATIAESLLPLQ